MVLNKNIFNVSNPANILEALWNMIECYAEDLSNVLIFLPSRRAIRSVERMIVDKVGHAVILPNLVPLGSGIDDDIDDEDLQNVISNQERVIILAKLLSADASIGNISTALPIAHDLVRMQDYLENEGIDIKNIDWKQLVGDRYAVHFQRKAEILNIIKQVTFDKVTELVKKKQDIKKWKDKLDEYKKVIVCGSTASVPTTADLMEEIAKRDNGCIILSGKIDGDIEDFDLDTNPYNSEYKFIKRLGIDISDITTLDTGSSKCMDVMNIAFGNSGQRVKEKLDNCNYVECYSESEEAAVATEITNQAIKENKSVLIVTPDIAANQRIRTEMLYSGITADFSSGISGNMTDVGRAILNLFNFWIENNTHDYEELYAKSGYNLFQMLVDFVDNNDTNIFQPSFVVENKQDIPIWESIKSMSDILCKNGIRVNVQDAMVLIKDSISSVSIRQNDTMDSNVCVIGTIESRMQTADVIILTGLNESVFPSLGYENAWLPRSIAKEIGLPSPDKKVSLMALDFMTLSCGKEVYWLRSKQSSGVLTKESRFISRMRVAVGDKEGKLSGDNKCLDIVRERNNVEYKPLDYSPPAPPIDKSDVFVTDIELLIHNPYAFYAKHILHLTPQDDYWVLPDARNFGNLVHETIEHTKVFKAEELIKQMDEKAKQILPQDSVLFYFWHKRFCEIAPFLEETFKDIKGEQKECYGYANIAGRNVRARADMILDGVVIDVKTGAAPERSKLIQGTMPQLPLEGYMMQNGGFNIKMKDVSATPILRFLQLQKGHVELIEYSGTEAQEMIDNTYQKVKELFGMYSTDTVREYEYRVAQGEKYHMWDDLARIDD